MKISIIKKNKAVNLSAPFVKRICKTVAEGEGERFDELNVFFVSKEEIGLIHEEFFNDPSPTDCITFPIDGPEESYRVLGDIFVCPEVAIEYSLKRGLNPEEECALYVVHGLLHLFGYDDINESDRKIMKTAEKRYMEILFP